MYAGKRYTRGILADVWVSENSGKDADDPYSSTEIFFFDSDYNIQVGEVNELKMV